MGTFKCARSFFLDPDSSENQSDSSDIRDFDRLCGVIRLLLGRRSRRFVSPKFTEFLLIPKVLNLPILQDRRLYSTVGYLIFGYIGFAFFLDWIRFIERTYWTAVFLKGNILSLETKGIFGKNVFRWDCRQSGVQIVHKTGLLRKFLGLERIVIVTADLKSEGGELHSPFFFRAQNGDLIRGLFKN